jgi:hypothetical protein
MIVRAGGPCTCKEGRYVRFVIPPGVPGCRPVISCREVDAAKDTIHEHAIPAGTEIHIRAPGLS